jgi:transcriptional regulator with XRE-family HTH domain
MHLINKEIGRKIKTKRNEIGFKQEVLASELGISQSALSRMENGVEDISVIVLLKLSKILNTHISYFIAESLTALTINTNNERIKLIEEMLSKNEKLIEQHVKVIKQQEDLINELQAKVACKNKKIDELKEITPQKNMPSN